MECHIEQVLYRDQRTTKTRYFEACEPHDHQPCLSCYNNVLQPHTPTENRRFHSTIHFNHHRDSFCSNLDDALSIRGSNSSLDNCHDQYCSKFKRLMSNRTECRCEDVSIATISERRRRSGDPTWIKKLQNVLLLSTYLSLLTLPNTYAVPTMCNRPSDKTPGFWVNPCGPDVEPNGEPTNELNVTAINNTITSTITALSSARHLKDKFRDQMNDTGSDPEQNYQSVEKYIWLLPDFPKFSSKEEFQQHLNSLKWQESLPTMFKYMQLIAVPLEQVVLDAKYTNDPFCGNYSQMEGYVLNILCDLHDSISDNNLRIEENVKRDSMPEDARNYCHSITHRTLRDWIILRELVNVLEYTLEVCKHFAKWGSDGNTY